MLDPANPDHYQYLSDFAHHLESIGQPAEARKLRESLDRSTHHQRSTTTMPNTKHDLRPRTLGINHAIGANPQLTLARQSALTSAISDPNYPLSLEPSEFTNALSHPAERIIELPISPDNLEHWLSFDHPLPLAQLAVELRQALAESESTINPQLYKIRVIQCGQTIDRQPFWSLEQIHCELAPAKPEPKPHPQPNPESLSYRGQLEDMIYAMALDQLPTDGPEFFQAVREAKAAIYDYLSEI